MPEYDPTIPAPGVPNRRHYCTCRHLKLQHGRTDYRLSRDGCWWCECGQDHADHRAAEARRAA